MEKVCLEHIHVLAVGLKPRAAVCTFTGHAWLGMVEFGHYSSTWSHTACFYSLCQPTPMATITVTTVNSPGPGHWNEPLLWLQTGKIILIPVHGLILHIMLYIMLFFWKGSLTFWYSTTTYDHRYFNVRSHWNWQWKKTSKHCAVNKYIRLHFMHICVCLICRVVLNVKA